MPPAEGRGTYFGGTKYHCSRFKKVVDPNNESCKVHERYVEVTEVQNDRQITDVATLYYALARYGRHDSDDSLKECASTRGGSCDCGYCEALEFAKESVQKRPHKATKTLPQFLTQGSLDAIFDEFPIIGNESETDNE
jgi:hypothetical protein